MLQKWLDKLFITIIILFFTSLSANAATDWGTKGVSDTSKVTNIVQLTTTVDAVGQSSLMGGNYPEYNEGNVQPWRKDGRWITFTSRVAGTSDSDREVCTIKADGSSFLRLTNNAVSDSNASFSTDGRIYFSLNTLTPNWIEQSWRMNQDGSSPANLSGAHLATQSEYSAVISPDGLKIAYFAYSSGNFLMVANADGTSPVQVSGTYDNGGTITNISTQVGQYSWSPDSQWLTYAGYAGARRIYRVKVDGSSHTQLTLPGSVVDSTYQHYWPTWSPDGSKIAYLMYQNVGAPTYYHFYEIRTILASDGSALKTLDTADTATVTGWQDVTLPASWSPDSMWLAYTKKYTGDGTPTNPSYKAIFMVNVADTVPAPSQLTTGYNDYFPIWSPNGTQLVFQSEDFRLSREDDTCNPSCVDSGDILVINLSERYAPPSPFPWHMFTPATQDSD